MTPRKPTKEDGWIPFLEAFGSGQADGTIEAQEARGQVSLVNSDTLPTEMRNEDRTILEAAGVKFLSVVEDDPLFQYVELPPGWRKQPTDHSLWSDLLDQHGRKRASIGYKAAFYDRWAKLSTVSRYRVSVDYTRRDREGVTVAQVLDGDSILYETKPVFFDDSLPGWAQSDAAVEKADQWLATHYPDYKNHAAYWD